METSKRYKYVIVPVIILLSMYTFVMHGLWLLIYFLFILKDTKFSVSLRFLLSIVFTGLLSVIVYVLTSIVSAPFYGGNLLSLSQKYAETGDIIETLRVFFRQTLGRLLSFDIVHLLQDMNFSKYLILAFWILLAVVAFRIFMKAEEFQRDELICIYTLASTYLIYLVVYTEYEGNLVRGLSIALVNCAFWMIAVNKKYFYALYILIFGLVGFTTFEETGIAYGTRSSYAEEIAYYEQTKEEITKALQIDPKKKGWENTIDVYSCDYQLDIMMPSGLGINQMWDDYVVEDSQAHWAAIYTDNVMNADFIALNYSIVYQNDLVTVYCYPAYADR